jgi:MOSC domain-containing protein YiiM
MELLSVNIASAQPIKNGGKTGITGIFKNPHSGPMQMERLGLAGDAIVDVESHGGVDQAIYVFGMADYAWWARALGRSLEPGIFGENLTISEMSSAQICIGDQLQIGTARLEVTAPRIPCSTLAARMGDAGFVKLFRAAERPGFYCRVIEPGEVCAGEYVNLAPYSGERVTVIDMFRLYYNARPSATEIRQMLAVPIAIRAREDYEKQLGHLLSTNTGGA